MLESLEAFLQRSAAHYHYFINTISGLGISITYSSLLPFLHLFQWSSFRARVDAGERLPLVLVGDAVAGRYFVPHPHLLHRTRILLDHSGQQNLGAWKDIVHC